MSQSRLLQLAAVTLAALGTTTACQKSAREERNEAQVAATKVERTGERTVQELEHGDANSIGRALKAHAASIAELEQEESEAIAAAAKERASYKEVLDKELGFTEQRITELESETARASEKAREGKARDLSAARWFRDVLQKDRDEIEATGEDVWPALKERIDRDLEDERPKSVPRSIEKSYGI